MFHYIFCLINHRFKNDNQRVVSFYAHVGGSDDFDAVLHVSFRPHRTSNLLRKTATKMHPHLPLQHEVIFFLYWIVWEKYESEKKGWEALSHFDVFQSRQSDSRSRVVGRSVGKFLGATKHLYYLRQKKRSSHFTQLSAFAKSD